MTQLSQQQRRAIEEHPGEPVRVVDDVTQSTYVLLPSQSYERVRALFEEEEFDVGHMEPLIDEVAAKEGWDDPAMNVYDASGPHRS